MKYKYCPGVPYPHTYNGEDCPACAAQPIHKKMLACLARLLFHLGSLMRDLSNEPRSKK